MPPSLSTTLPPASAATSAAEPLVAILRRIGALAAPTMGIALLQAGAQLLETALAARQGTAALAGWAVLLPFALLLQQMSTGAMGGGVVSAIARALGAQRREEASALVLHALVIATGFGLLFAIGLSLGARPLLTAVAGPEAAEAATLYAVWLFGIGALPTWWANTLASVLRGGGRHAVAARVLTATWVVYPLLAWPLAGRFGLPGIAAAFALASWAAAGLLAVVVLRGGAGFVPDLRTPLSAALFKRILAVGAVACALAAISNFTTILVTAQLRRYGTAAVAAYGISARLEFMVVPLAFGVGSALTALVGRAAGAGDWATARRTAWAGGLMALAGTGALGLVVSLFALPFAQLFTGNAEVAAIAAQALHFVGLGFGGFGLGMAMYFAAMGAGRMRYPVAAALSRIGIAAGGGWWLAHAGGMGLQGHFIAVALGITAYGLVTAAGVRPGNWPGGR